MQLGDPSNAKADSSNHDHYLIQRNVFAMDYDDERGEPNWVSWDLTAEDIGPAKRSPTFHGDSQLPNSFHEIRSADYKQSGFDRGHMCPSADRTDDSADNEAVFVMSNIVPQSKDNNEGVWEKLESDCREWARQGNELLIICGPSEFSNQHLNNSSVLIPAHTWKIVLEVPDGSGPVLNRITANTRVVAVDIPNVQGIRSDPWTKYLVSVNQLETETGFKFFTALPPEVAMILKAKIDGKPTPTVAALKAESPGQSSAPPQINWVPVAIIVLAFILLLAILALLLFIWTVKKR